MKLVGMHLGALNGEVFYKMGTRLVGFVYGTPMFNDYNEWRLSEVKIYNEEIESDFGELPFEIELSKEYPEVESTLKEWLSNEDPKDRMPTNSYFDLEVKMVTYRAPTEEELKEAGNVISDYKVGLCISTFDEDEVLFENYKSENEVLDMSIDILQQLMKNKEAIYATGRGVLMT